MIQNHFFLGADFLVAVLVFGAFEAFGVLDFLEGADFLTIFLVFPADLLAAFFWALLGAALAGDLAGDEVVAATGAGVVVVAGVVTAGVEAATLGLLDFLWAAGLAALVAFWALGLAFEALLLDADLFCVLAIFIIINYI